jgi:hypothetical protein
MQGIVTRTMVRQIGAVVGAQAAEDLAKAPSAVDDAGIFDGVRTNGGVAVS